MKYHISRCLGQFVGWKDCQNLSRLTQMKAWIFRFSNGDTFEGYMQNGVRHGYGLLRTMKDNDMEIYFGGWRLGLRSGYGVSTSNSMLQIFQCVSEKIKNVLWMKFLKWPGHTFLLSWYLIPLLDYVFVVSFLSSARVVISNTIFSNRPTKWCLDYAVESELNLEN